MSRTEQMLDKGFGSWEQIQPELGEELREFHADDPQFFDDWTVLMERAQSGTCRRKIEGRGVLDDGDWDSPMASSSLDMGELRMPESDQGWMIRTYVSACVRNPGVMVALLVGDKACNGPGAIASTQNEHIGEAGARLMRRERSFML